MDSRVILTAAAALWTVVLIVHGRRAAAAGAAIEPTVGALVAAGFVLALVWLPTSVSNWIIPLLVAFVVANGGKKIWVAGVVFLACEGVAALWPQVPITLVAAATLLGVAFEISSARARRRRLDVAPRLDPQTSKGSVVAVRGRATWPLEVVPGRDERSPLWLVQADGERTLHAQHLVLLADAAGAPLCLVDARGAQVELHARHQTLRAAPNVRKTRHAIAQLDPTLRPETLQWIAIVPPGGELEAHGPVDFERAPAAVGGGYRDGALLPVLRSTEGEKVWLTDLTREAIAARLRHTVLAWAGWGGIVTATAVARLAGA